MRNSTASTSRALSIASIRIDCYPSHLYRRLSSKGHKHKFTPTVSSAFRPFPTLLQREISRFGESLRAILSLLARSRRSANGIGHPFSSCKRSGIPSVSVRMPIHTSLPGCSYIPGATPSIDTPVFKCLRRVRQSALRYRTMRSGLIYVGDVDSVVASDRLFLTSCWDES